MAFRVRQMWILRCAQNDILYSFIQWTHLTRALAWLAVGAALRRDDIPDRGVNPLRRYVVRRITWLFRIGRRAFLRVHEILPPRSVKKS